MGVEAVGRAFRSARESGTAALMAFLMAGDPGVAESASLAEAAAAGGADLIEIGWPFSDPIADGPTVQAASERALRAGAGPDEVLGVCRQTADRTGLPVVLLSYLNPLLALGDLRALVDAGVSALVVPDLSLEESAGMRRELAALDVFLVPFAAPTSGPDRLRLIGEATGEKGFVYCVSLTGVTGRRAALSERAAPLLIEARRHIRAPLALGFGIGSPEAVREVAPLADGVIVGSALIEAHRSAGPKDAPGAVEAFVRSLKEAAGIPSPRTGAGGA